MMKLKHRKFLFSALLALWAGGSIAIYAGSDVDFVLKTAGLLIAQQLGAAFLYLLCFAPDLNHSPPLR